MYTKSNTSRTLLQIRRLDETPLGGVEARKGPLRLGQELLRLGLLVAA